jgi:hypothetical protein
MGPIKRSDWIMLSHTLRYTNLYWAFSTQRTRFGCWMRSWIFSSPLAILSQEGCRYEASKSVLREQKYKKSKWRFFFLLFEQSHWPSQMCYLVNRTQCRCFKQAVQSHCNTCLFGVRFSLQALSYTHSNVGVCTRLVFRSRHAYLM